MYTSYLMEGNDEALRLELKDNAQSTRAQLLATGISHFIRNGNCIVDAGTGVGVVSEQMADIIGHTPYQVKLTLLDASEERLQVARQHLSKIDEIEQSFIKCDLGNIPLPDDSVDYLFCRFVFEYLAEPDSVFSEFIRIVKPGGKIVVGDLDNNAMTHYPLSYELESQLGKIMAELKNKFSFDPNAGRKLYSFFYKNKCSDIKIHCFPHHLFYGELKDSDLYNWTSKLDRLIDLQKNGLIDLDFSVAEFGDKFIQFLKSPGRFSYTPLILVEGIVI